MSIEVRSTGGFTSPLGTAPDTQSKPPVPDANGTGNLGDVSLDNQALLNDLVKLGSTLGAGGNQGGITNGNGAPSIGNVTINFSPEDLAAALLVLQGKTQDAQLKTAREGLEGNRQKLQNENERALAKINDWVKKCEDAAAKAKAGGIMGWVSKIAGFVAAALATVVAAAATVATGGAAAPLLALAIVGMVGASISLASQISQECGGPALELSTLMTKACAALLTAVGVPEDKVDAAARTMAGAIGLTCGALILMDPSFCGELVGGIAQLAGADEMTNAILTGVFTAVASIAVSIVMVVATGGAAAGAAIDGIAKTVMTAGKIGQAVAGMASGAAAVAGGGVQIAKAHDERDAATAQADKKMIDALIAKLQQQMEEDREQIKKVLDEIMQGMTIVSQMINASGDSRSQISSNLAGKGQMI